MVTCPKCGKPAWKLADCTTNRSGFWRYDYARYRHPKGQYGKVKTCYILKERVCKKRELTISEGLREMIKGEGKLGDSFDFDTTFGHMRKCVTCQNALIDNGYVLVSIEKLKKYNLIVEKKPVRL